MKKVDPKARQEQTVTLLELQASQETWAIPALDVVRIIEHIPHEPLPQEDLVLSGLLEYESKKVPFMSLGRFLENIAESAGPIIIFEHPAGRIALGVSQVFTLKRIPVSMITPIPPIIGDPMYKAVFTGCYADEDRLIPVVDLKKLEF